jgi:hypothetical protein
MILLSRILLVLFAIVAAAALCAWLWRKHRRRRCVEDMHATRQRRIDHLDELIDTGERDARLAEDVAARLRHLVGELRAESLGDR